MSYDVSSLLTEIPLQETTDYILDQIYKENKLPQLTSRPGFKRLLERVTKGTVFLFDGNLYKQIDNCSMGNKFSPTIGNIFMCKVESDIVTPINLSFYDRYVDDCFIKRKSNTHDILLKGFNTTIRTSSSQWRKAPPISLTLRSNTKMGNSRPKYTRNRANSRFIGSHKHRRDGKKIRSLAHYIKQSASPLAGKKSNQLNKQLLNPDAR